MRTQWLQNGAPFFASRIKTLPQASAMLRHPFLVSFALSFDPEGTDREPSREEWSRIQHCELALRRFAAAHDALLAGSLTSGGLHQFLIYCRDPNFLKSRLPDALPPAERSRETAEVWELTYTEDREWNYLRKLPIDV
jgi:hypothetical protein